MQPSWYLYLGIFFGPFVQEDAAVLAAATLSASNPKHFPVVFFVILGGLILSDIWKYWIGYTAHAHPRARRFAEKERVINMADKVHSNLFATLMTARFVPLARVPAYVACGYFKVSYLKFCVIIAITALLYTTVIFAACHLLGEVFGERLEVILPLIGGGIFFVVLIGFFIKRWIAQRD
ncbi:DedA family protein [Litorimonas sp. RW-G-Af-16]|uniref:DedA family protein n=1 Tax=Litorimonas sp. RW-G-Af-16 TaxID=3241168 RepID=UPI00390CAA94